MIDTATIEFRRKSVTPAINLQSCVDLVMSYHGKEHLDLGISQVPAQDGKLHPLEGTIEPTGSRSVA